MNTQPTPEPVKESARWHTEEYDGDTLTIHVVGSYCMIGKAAREYAEQIAAAHNAAVEALEREVERLKGLLTRSADILGKYQGRYHAAEHAKKHWEIGAEVLAEIRAEIGG
jgi:hypothetical protein